MDQNCKIHQNEPEWAICNNNQCRQTRLMCFLCKDNHMGLGCPKEQHLTFNQGKNELDKLIKQMLSSIENLQIFCCVQQRVILEEMLTKLDESFRKLLHFENIIKNSQELNWQLQNISLNEYKLKARQDNKTISQYTEQYEKELLTLNKIAKIDYFNILEQEKIIVLPIQQNSPYFEDFNQITNYMKKLISKNQYKFDNSSIYNSFLQKGDIALVPICEILIKEKYKLDQPVLDQQIGLLCHKILRSGPSPRYYSLVCFSPNFDQKQKNDILETIKDMDKNNLDYLSFMSAGKYFLDQNSFPEANLNFKEAIKLKQDYSVLHYLNGNSLFQLKKYKGAIQQYEKAIQLEHDFKLAYIQLAKSYMLTQQYQNAIDACIKALIYDKNDKDANNILEICEKGLKL